MVPDYNPDPRPQPHDLAQSCSELMHRIVAGKLLNEDQRYMIYDICIIYIYIQYAYVSYVYILIANYIYIFYGYVS